MCSLEQGEHREYNTADASLWFFEAWRAYVEATDDVSALRQVSSRWLSDMIDGISAAHATALASTPLMDSFSRQALRACS